MELLAPVSGTVLRLEEVPDPVFGPGMMGGGAAIQPPAGRSIAVVSPVSGTVMKARHHALIVRAADGVVLIHLGIDTNSLDGLGFSLEISKGDELEAGQRVGTWDTIAATEQGRSTCTVVVVLESDPKAIEVDSGREVDAGEAFFSVP